MNIAAAVYETVDGFPARFAASTGSDHGYAVGVGSSREEAMTDLAMQLAGLDWDRVSFSEIKA